jgi:hypothetical protein
MPGKNGIFKVNVSLGPKKIIKVRAQSLPARLVVFIDPPRVGQLGIPYWENQLAHEALERAASSGNEVKYSGDILIFQVVPDVYTALRQTLHILHQNYGRTFSSGEKKALESALSHTQRLHNHLIGLRKGNLDQLFYKVQASALDIIMQVGTNPRDEFKREARDLAVVLGGVVDSWMRANSPAKLWQVAALRRRLQSRLDNILRIEPQIAARRQALKSLIDIMEFRHLAASNFIEWLYLRLEPTYFKKHPLLEKKVSARLQFLVSELDELKIEPFVFPDKNLHEELKRAAWYIERQQFGYARRVLSVSRESLKLRVVRTTLENFITHITQLQFKPRRTLLAPEIAKIDKGFTVILDRLRKIDESRFKKPVCKSISALIKQARALFRKHMPGPAVLLEASRRKLVEAVQNPQL